MSKRQTCILVLGMHRSGTSAITGLLHLLGVNLGTDLLLPRVDNPKGFFENNKIWQFNQKLLEIIGTDWDDLFLYERSQSLSIFIEHYQDDVIELLDEEFSDTSIFAIKDPRLCVLFPLWKAALDKKGVHTVCVFPFRYPVEVARSLAKRNSFSIKKGLLLWAKYTLIAEKESRGCDRLFLEFKDLFSNIKEVVSLLSRELNVTFPNSYENVKEQLVTFLERDIKQSDFKEQGEEVVEEHIIKIYEHYCSASKGKIDDIWFDTQDKLAEAFFQMHSFFLNDDLRAVANPGVLRHAKNRLADVTLECIDTHSELSKVIGTLKKVQGANEYLQDEIKAMQATKAWRLAELFRNISDMLIDRDKK